MANLEALHHFLRSEFESEACRDFARLKCVPDTEVRQFLDYYASLSSAEQDALADASTLRATLEFAWRRAPEKDLQTYQNVWKSNAAWKRWVDEAAMGRLHYESVPSLRSCVAQAKMDRARGIDSTISKEIEEYAGSIRSVKASELRKYIRSAFESLLGAKPANMGGGDWEYQGTLNGCNIAVRIDYGGQHAQLRYEVDVSSTVPFCRLRGIGFEVALGVGHGDWDFIVEENVSDSIELLTKFVTYVSELPGRLPDNCLDYSEIER